MRIVRNYGSVLREECGGESAAEDLTDFQRRAESELTQRLNTVGEEFRSKRITKTRDPRLVAQELWIEALVGDLEIWIYPIGADIGGKDFGQAFEAPDYRTEGELIEAFVSKVASLLLERNRK